MTRYLLVLLCASVATLVIAEEPLTRPDLDRPVLGLITRATLAEAMPGRAPKGKPKKGLVVAGAMPGSPASTHWREIGHGSILSRIGREVIATEAELDRVLAASPPGEPLSLEISEGL